MITQKPPCLSKVLEAAYGLYGKLPCHHSVSDDNEIILQMANVFGRYTLHWTIPPDVLKKPFGELEQWMIYNAKEVQF